MCVSIRGNPTIRTKPGASRVTWIVCANKQHLDTTDAVISTFMLHIFCSAVVAGVYMLFTAIEENNLPPVIILILYYNK